MCGIKLTLKSNEAMKIAMYCDSGTRILPHLIALTRTQNINKHF